MSLIRFRCIDVVVLTLFTGSMVTLVAAAGVSKREQANRVKCASNLQRVGAAMLLYATQEHGHFPRTTYVAGSPPVWGTPYPDDPAAAVPVQDSDPFADPANASREVLAAKPRPNDVTAAMYLLVRSARYGLDPDVFVCPSTRLQPYGRTVHHDRRRSARPTVRALSYNDSIKLTNFPGKGALAAHLSYSYQNPYPTNEAVTQGFKFTDSQTAEFAMMADMNPGTPAVLTTTSRSDPTDMRKANSFNHRQDGQNVLYCDGRVEFVNTPWAGVQRDNIYVAGSNGVLLGKAKPTIVASPADGIDSILLPSAADVGQVLPRDMPITNTGDAVALQQTLLGAFKASTEGRAASLTIREIKITLVEGPMTIAMNYKVLGKRAEKTVIELTADSFDTTQADIDTNADQITIDGDLDWFDGVWARQP